jgi:transcriptional regulator with XRE-family HTH domain
MRTINLDKLKYWLVQNGALAKEDLASKSRIKFYTIGRIIDGKRMPTELEQTAICKATGLTKDELFPTVESKEKSA